MKNYIGYLLKSKITLNVKGRNIERFIKRLKNNNIEILKIKNILNDEIIVKIYYEDYKKIIEIKTIYEITKIDYYGFIGFKNKILNNKFIILCVFISSIFVYLLSNIIFDIEILTNDSKMSNLLISELENYGIKKYNFKKNYTDIQLIKKEIINNYKDKIDWLEIENIGTKYIIRYEPRIINEDNKKTNFRHIIASKDAIITDMDISNGQIVKGINSYVKKGDIIVSGYISMNDNIKDTVSSTGNVYGETWYQVTINYPFKYFEKIETGNNNKVLVITFLNNKIELFNFNKYKTKNINEHILLKNNLLPIYISLQEQKETKIINENNTEEDAINKAIDKAKKQIEKTLEDKEYIKEYKILKKYSNDKEIGLKIFFSVIEDITEYQTIDKYQENLE